MTVNRGRIDRGKETQLILAHDWFAEHGWPYAEAVGGGRGGTDITGMPGLLVECKAEAGWRPTTWLRQHPQDELLNGHRRPTPLMLAVQRPNGYGPARLAEWPVIMRLDRATWLLREAGYGDWL